VVISTRTVEGAFLSPSTKSAITSSSQRNMFTGIIEEMGTVVALEEKNDLPLWDGSTGSGTELTVKGNVVMDGAYLGYVYVHVCFKFQTKRFNRLCILNSSAHNQPSP
jgi:hypothetical protein